MDAVGLYEPAIKLMRPVSPDECFHAVMDGTADIVAIEAHLAVEAIGRLGYRTSDHRKPQPGGNKVA